MLCDGLKFDFPLDFFLFPFPLTPFPPPSSLSVCVYVFECVFPFQCRSVFGVGVILCTCCERKFPFWISGGR